MMRIRVELETLSTTTSQIPDELLNALTRHHETLADTVQRRISQFVDLRISQVEEMMLAQSKTLRETQLTQVGSSYQRTRAQRCSSSQSIHSQILQARASDDIAVRVNRYRLKCRSGCTCVCHKERKSSGSFLNKVFGQVFVGYAGLPFISPKCDITDCEKAQVPFVSAEYWFPLGFCWSKIIQLQVIFQPSFGPRFNISTFRSVPDTAACVEFALHGNIDGLKCLFARGEASPWDVSITRGYTLARVCSTFSGILFRVTSMF